MKYKFTKLDFWEELKAAIGDIPYNVEDSGDEITFDFGKGKLTPLQEDALKTLMATKPMMRGKLSRFVEKLESEK